MKSALFALALFLAGAAVLAAPTRAPVAHDALDEVNAARARRRLPPFKRDADLTRGAMAAASYRAERRIRGHAKNDFAFLPDGANAAAAGCAAWPEGDGWGACATYEHWKYAGAAWAKGRDGLRYMHLFVRN